MSQEEFRIKFETEGIEKDYAGLYCLLRLAQEPDEAGTEEAARYLRNFYFPELVDVGEDDEYKVLEDDSKSASGELKCEKVESNPNSQRTMTIDQKRKYSI